MHLGGLRPPGKVRLGTDDLRQRLQRETTLGLHGLHGVEVRDVSIGQRFIGQGPEPLGWLELRRVRGQPVQMHPCGNGHLRTHMPARAVAHEEDLLALPRTHRLGELCQGNRERGDRDRGE
jgi:hypothetical protein